MTPNQTGTEWEKEFLTVVWKALKGNHNDLRREKMILDAARSLLRTSQARMVEKIEKSPFEMNVEDYLPLVRAWKGGYDIPFGDGYKKGKADAIAIIKGEDKGV